MKLSYNWLKEYVGLKIGPDKLGDLLTMAGLTTEAIHNRADDSILEVEVTANRPDWLSYIGVAREISAIIGTKLKVPPVKASKKEMLKGGSEVRLTIDERALCPKYTARVIKDVKVGESPEWLKKKLEAMGLRSVNNIVDATNFCLFETGEPMHAFDLDKVEGAEIIVRNARPGEKIKTIDGVERELGSSMLVIADRTKPIAIAGVMGGLNTEVTSTTRNILLEAAYFDPISVRRTARSLAISSDSSYRFERKVDINNIEYASSRAAGLIMELAGGKKDALLSMGKKPEAKKEIILRFSRLDSILGLKIPPQTATRILTALGLAVKKLSKDSIKATPPSFRNDLNCEIDLVEEVARVHGYNKIPNTVPPLVEQAGKVPPAEIINDRIRSVLTGFGLYEILTYSLLGKNVLALSGIAENSVVEIKNPLSAEQEAMRPDLKSGMLTAILWNINRKSTDLGLFEIGNVYIKAEAGFREEKRLSIGVSGESSSWAEGSRKRSFFDLKGAVETLLSELGVKGAEFKNSKDGAYAPFCSAEIEIDGRKVGAAGKVSGKTLRNFGIKETVYFCEISLEALTAHAKTAKRFTDLPRYPSAHRDISIIVQKDTPNSAIVASIKNVAGTLLKDVKLIDKYVGKQIPEGRTSLTYRLEYCDSAKTLEEKDISSAQSAVLKALEEQYGAKLR